MKTIISIVVFFLLFASQSVKAHLMVAQHATLNIVEQGAYMVMSLPVSAFKGVDDNQDQRLSVEEFQTHREHIFQLVKQHVRLADSSGNLILQGLMVSPVMGHEHHSSHAHHHAVDGYQSASQLVIMGRFSLNNELLTHTFHVGLFGHKPAEQQIKVSVKHPRTKKHNTFLLTPEKPSSVLFQ